MTEEPTVKIKLKTIILSLDGKPNKQGIRLRSSDLCKKMTDIEFAEFTATKTMEELLELTPTDTLGEALRHILSNCIRPKDNASAAEIFSYITKINNCMIKDKAEWTVTKDELKKFQDLIGTARENITALINGQVDSILEGYYADLVQQNKA